MGRGPRAARIKRSYSDPLWSLKRGEVVAYEKVTLYGLTLVERRALSYASIDHVLCRDLFIREGLVNGVIQQPPEFFNHNFKLVAWVQDQEAKGGGEICWLMKTSYTSSMHNACQNIFAVLQI